MQVLPLIRILPARNQIYGFHKKIITNLPGVPVPLSHVIVTQLQMT